MAVRFRHQTQTCTRVVEMMHGAMGPNDKLVNPLDAEKGPGEMVSVYQEYTQDIFVPERIPDIVPQLTPPVMTPTQCTGDLNDRLAADVRAMQRMRIAA